MRSLAMAALGLIVLLGAALAVDPLPPDAPKDKEAAPPDKPAPPAKPWAENVEALRKSGLEVMIVVDSTGSMGGILLEFKTRLKPLLDTLAAVVPDVRLGAVLYRDKKQYDREDYDFTAKYMQLEPLDKEGVDRLLRFWRDAGAYGGGDIPEAVLDGVQTAAAKAGWTGVPTDMEWRDDAAFTPRRTEKKTPPDPKSSPRRVIVVIGDAPPHPEDNGVAKTVAACKAWKEAGGALSCIDTTGANKLMPEFGKMAEAGGGEAFALNDERKIIQQTLIAVFGSAYKAEVEKAYNKAVGTKEVPKVPDGPMEFDRVEP